MEGYAPVFECWRVRDVNAVRAGVFVRSRSGVSATAIENGPLPVSDGRGGRGSG